MKGLYKKLLGVTECYILKSKQIIIKKYRQTGTFDVLFTFFYHFVFLRDYGLYFKNCKPIKILITKKPHQSEFTKIGFAQKAPPIRIILIPLFFWHEQI